MGYAIMMHMRMIPTSNARYIFSRSDFRQSGTNQSTTIQSQGIIYLAVAKLRVGPAAFRLVSAYVILERARKRGVRWRVGVRHTPFAVDRSRNVSEFHRASDSRRFLFSFFFFDHSKSSHRKHGVNQGAKSDRG